MIVLDTHIWVWWVDGSTRLTPGQVQHLRAYEAAGLGVSVISCWEVAKLVEVGGCQDSRLSARQNTDVNDTGVAAHTRRLTSRLPGSVWGAESLKVVEME